MNAEEREPGLIRYLPIVLILAVLGVCLIGLYADRKHLRTEKPKVYHITVDKPAVAAPPCAETTGPGMVYCTAEFVPIPKEPAQGPDRSKRIAVSGTTTTLGALVVGSGGEYFTQDNGICTQKNCHPLSWTSTTDVLSITTDGCVSPFTYDSHSKLCTTTLTFATTPNEVHCDKTVANQMICTYVPLDADHPDECKPGECLDGWAPEVQGYLCSKKGLWDQVVKLSEPCAERQMVPANQPIVAFAQIVMTEKQRDALPGNAWVKPCAPGNREDACYTPDPVPVCKMPADIDVCPVVQMDKKEAHQ